MQRRFMPAISRFLTLIAACGALLAEEVPPAEAASFAETCLQQFQVVEVQLPYQIDIATACECQGRQLERLGYNSDTFFSDIDAVFRNLNRQETNAPTGEERHEAMSKYNKMMQDNGMAFMACIQADVKRAVDIEFRQRMGKGS